jgi:hypothetical protein
LRVVFLFSIVI